MVSYRAEGGSERYPQWHGGLTNVTLSGRTRSMWPPSREGQKEAKLTNGDGSRSVVGFGRVSGPGRGLTEPHGR